MTLKTPNILTEIVVHKQKEVAKRKELYPTKLLEKSTFFESPCVSLKEYILRPDKSGIIAEFKRRSPSKPKINLYADPEKVTIGYMQAGASALSVLTDEHYFGGSSSDLITARKFNYCPILRKDFVVDEYQIIEAKSIGADAILLIAEILSAGQLCKLSRLAQNLGLEVLCELHSEDQLVKISKCEEESGSGIELLGVNNRDLKSFTTSIENSLRIKDHLPEGKTLISESGIQNVEQLVRLRSAGFSGFLIGELFMKEDNPGMAARGFVQQLNQ